MLIGGAVREAAGRGVRLTPVFSLFSYHGPVFRAMLRAERGCEWRHEQYAFLAHCYAHDHPAGAVPWKDVNNAVCRCVVAL